uniref:SMB domain-containing protein n=1 Tax=Heterorhabditis bacteriophora TaxID=37862 RepID=A0A1I7WX63_HETBA
MVHVTVYKARLIVLLSISDKPYGCVRALWTEWPISLTLFFQFHSSILYTLFILAVYFYPFFYCLNRPQDDNAPAKLVDSRVSSTRSPPKTTPAKKTHHLIFGMPEGPDYPPEEELRYHPKPKHLLIRYSILSQYLPLTVSTTPSSDYRDHNAKFMYLEAGSVDCYCDESCVALGDCCSDYTFITPKVLRLNL